MTYANGHVAEPKEASGRRSIPDSGGRSLVSSAVAVGLGLALVIGGALLYRKLSEPDGTAPAPSASAAGAERAPRCVEVVPGKNATIGEAGSKAAAGSDDAEQADRDDMLSPFAVVLGRAAAFDGGYAVGVQGEGEGGTLSTLVVVSADGSTAKPIKLSRSRGDLDPPVVAVAGKAFVVALIEPNAGGRAVRLARVEGETVSWGAELRESNDESLALDVAVSGEGGLVAWDALDDDKSYVAVSGFAVATPGVASEPRRLTPKGVDADAPRLVPRPGGFYAVYQVRGLERDRHAARPAPPAQPEPPAAEEKPKKKPKTKRDPGDVDETLGGESVAFTWLEVLLLDANGAPAGDAVRLTPDNGHVISYDVAPAQDGGLVVAYRDEDSPTGAGGGPVKALRIAPGGGVAESYQSQEETPSDGAPTLLPGWMAIPTLRGADLLGRLGENGLPKETVEVETSLGRGEPIAARGDELLLAEPAGKAMRLSVVKCGERAAEPVKEPKDDEP